MQNHRISTLRKIVPVLLGSLFFLGIPFPGHAQESTAEETDSALMKAYQREFVFLNNEIQLLEERLQQVESDGQNRVKEAEAFLEQLEEDLLNITAEVDRRTEELRILEDESLDIVDTDDALRNIVDQAANRFRERGVPGYDAGGAPGERDEGEELSNRLAYSFTRSFDLLEEVGSIRTEEGQFFLEDGRQVEGSLVRIGEVAAFGISGNQGGTLAPAGGGRMRLVETSTKDLAEALVEGTAVPAELPLYLYESADEMAEIDRGGSLRDTIKGGGIIGLVIIGIGFIAFILIIIRIILLRRVGSPDEGIVSRSVTALEEKDPNRALEIIMEQKGAAGRVLRATLEGLSIDREHIEDVISESVLNEQPAIDRFRSAISVFAAVAPLLGLLGTVTGMIATFDVITRFGTGDPGLLSGGISEALVTTELGLIVAIPTLLIGNLLSSWADRITSNLEISALRLVNVVTGYGKKAETVHA